MREEKSRQISFYPHFKSAMSQRATKKRPPRGAASLLFGITAASHRHNHVQAVV